MALVITAFPPNFSSFQDDLVFTVTDTVKVSDPVTYPNFKFIGDVYIDGVFVARLKKVPNPLTGVGIFNIGQIVRAYANIVFNPGSGLVSQVIADAAFHLEVKIQYGEEYSFTDFLDITIGTTQFFYNSYNSRLNGAVSSIVAKVDRLATNRSLTLDSGKVLFSTSTYLVSYLSQFLTPVAVVVTPILSCGSLGSPFTTSFTLAAAWDLQVLNLSPQNINTLSPGLLNATMQGYKVKVGPVDTITIMFICEAQYTPVTVHFLNQYGGFDSQIFTKVSRRAYDIIRAQFGKLPYTVDGSGIVSYKNINGVYNETDSTYSSQFTDTLILNSDLLTDTEYVWLRDLILSPMVYVEDSGYFYSVQIQENNYEAKKNINDELTNLTITLKYGKTFNAQYR